MNTYNKKAFLLITLLLFCFIQEFQAQSDSGYRIKQSNLGNSGSSHMVETSSGKYYISQSIGQASVIGTHYNNGYYIRQGYQQPPSKMKAVKDLDIELRAKVYPNPFSQTLFINFSDTVINDISVRIFDIEARIIHTQEFLPAQKLELRLQDISSGTYFLKVASGRKQFNTKLIKI
ncbi:T9SS type A sorting domain-containing protein [Winogradskyella flava]|uniref:T9SS type A sorting domain-containing protein n=1 Tax=Winogradskyella flava TaxID=1884876 RepID=A0A842IZ71_9FLAO|nr:T9SS type A sorting domain-containing protein [Winogradskyella flava]MBC2846048.1 T9SS type A sorting domain-containing protein [Winogradskyella flava]